MIEQRTTHYTNIIEENNTDHFFTDRIIALQKIHSHHMFNIEKAAIAERPFITYQEKVIDNLSNIIENKIQLLPSQIKSIIWQITKLMLTCQNQNTNHLRLCPRSIVLREKYEKEGSIFIKVKDFSLGKQFESVKEGKIQQIFEYLHPDLSIKNKRIDFRNYTPQFDIWSLGIILYKLIYFQSPFVKSGRTIFSKTILRQYLNDDYEIVYTKNKYESVNRFIGRCLFREDGQNYYRNWGQIKKSILNEQEIYHDLDFYDGQFQKLGQLHYKTMIFLSMMYCMIIDQCKQSSNSFWKIPLSKSSSIPFQITICQFTLTFMMVLEERFKRIYSKYFPFLRKSLSDSLNFISLRLKDQLQFRKNKWIYEKLCTQTITPDIISIIQDICVRFKLQISQENQKIQVQRLPVDGHFDSKIMKQKRANLLIKKKPSNADLNKKKDKKIWRSMQILHDYCSEVLDILATSKARMKYISEEFYINSVFHSILNKQFGCKANFIDLFKIVYKEYE